MGKPVVSDAEVSAAKRACFVVGMRAALEQHHASRADDAMQLLQRITECSHADPAAKKVWSPQLQNKWMTVNMPKELWIEIEQTVQKSK